MSKQFSATTDVISLGNPVHYRNPGPLTYAAWISPTAYGNPSSGRILEKARASDGAGHVFFMDAGAGGTIQGKASKSGTDATVVAAWPAGNLEAQGWWFVALTYAPNDGGPRLWRGRVSTAVTEMVYSSRSDGSGSLLDVSPFALLIGASALAAKNAFQGRIGQVSVWQGALSLKSLENLRQRPAAQFHRPQDGQVLGYWPLDQAEPAGQALDQINGNHGAVTGTKPHLNQAHELDGTQGF
jgi:hypothetical protein